MNRNKKRLTRSWVIAPWVALVALMAVGSNPLSAQTLEGVVITNTATATYTDANGNVYTDATGSVSVTVGFQGSLVVTSPAATSPSSPSTGNTATWTITNNGNGSDQIQVAVTSSDTDVAGNITYVYGGNPYATLALLNAQLALVPDSIARTDNITIDVIYDVASGEGGNASNVQLTATSTRTGGDTNNSTTVVTAVLGGSLSVAADNPALGRLPSNGTVLYIETFQVGSGLTGTDDVDLLASLVAPNDATISLQGIREQGAPTWEVGPAHTLSFAPGETKTIEVRYRVDGGVADAGTNTLVRLTATNAAATPPGVSDDHDVTIIAPDLAVAKSVYASEGDAQLGLTPLAIDPEPGTTIWYRVQITNNGTATAVLTGGSYGLSDDFSGLPVTYVAASVNQTGSPVAWTTLTEAAGVISGTIAGGLPGGGGTAWFVFAVTIN